MDIQKNPGTGIIWRYGRMIPPGETFIFDHPHASPDAPLPAVATSPPAFYPQGETEDNPFVSFLDRPVAEIRTKLSQFGLDDLAELKATELSGQNRKSLLSAIDGEIDAQ